MGYICWDIRSCATFEKKIVNWIKNLLGIDEMQSKLTRIENNNSLILSNLREELKKPEIQNFTDLRLLNPITG